MSFQGKRVANVGGSLGLDLATAKTVVEQNANVLIAGRSEDKLTQVVTSY